MILEGVEAVEVTYHATRPFEGGPGIIIRQEDWTVLPNRQVQGQLQLQGQVEGERGAVELKITDSRGTETSHLFEVGS